MEMCLLELHRQFQGYIVVKMAMQIRIMHEISCFGFCIIEILTFFQNWVFPNYTKHNHVSNICTIAFTERKLYGKHILDKWVEFIYNLDTNLYEIEDAYINKKSTYQLYSCLPIVPLMRLWKLNESLWRYNTVVKSRDAINQALICIMHGSPPRQYGFFSVLRIATAVI